MGGKRQVFSVDENSVLREALRTYRAEHNLSQAAMGLLIGIKQQNVARLEDARNAETGLNRDTAHRLAHLLGFRDAEELLLERGVLAAMQPVPGGSGWSDRDIAVRIARRIGYTSAAIEAVVHRYASPDYRAKPLRWWTDQIFLEDLGRREEPAATVAMATPTRKPPKKRRSGTHG